MKKFFKRLICKHCFNIFIENIYGDDINLMGGRSIHECSKCGKRTVSEYLFKE